MRYIQGCLFCLILGGGMLGAVPGSGDVGRLVTSEAERTAVIGAACLGQGTVLEKICSGGEKSDCTGCGCVDEYPVKDEDQGYAAPLVECKDDANCKFNFRRGSCKKGSGD